MVAQLGRAVPETWGEPDAPQAPAFSFPSVGQRGVLVAAAEPALADGIAALFSEDQAHRLPGSWSQEQTVASGRASQEAPTRAPSGRFTMLEAVTAIPAAERALATYRPPLAVMVLDPPLLGGSTEAACARLLATQPTTATLVLLARPTPERVRRVCHSGARGVFETTVSPTDLIDALSQIDAGEVIVQPSLIQHLLGPSSGPAPVPPPPSERLNARALTALQLLARGYTSKEIAPILGTTAKAVNLTIERACRQLQAGTRSEAVAIAISRGLIS